MGIKSRDSGPNKRPLESNYYIKIINKQEYIEEVNHEFTNYVVDGLD